MNDFKYFKTLELDVQEKIITKLRHKSVFKCRKTLQNFID